MPSGSALSLIATLIGVAGAGVGVYSLSAAPRKIVPLSGALLAGVAAFGVYPELAGHYGWAGGALMMAAGIMVLWAFGRFVHPVCPTCSHTHDHEHCQRALHGFAGPLMAAGILHAFLDGLGISAGQQEPGAGLVSIIVLGVTLHKIPEGIAFGVMLRAAVKSRVTALASCIAIESATLMGALLESALTDRFGVAWTLYALALAGGSFLYLGYHAVHGQWRRHMESVSAGARVPQP